MINVLECRIWFFTSVWEFWYQYLQFHFLKILYFVLVIDEEGNYDSFALSQCDRGGMTCICTIFIFTEFRWNYEVRISQRSRCQSSNTGKYWIYFSICHVFYPYWVSIFFFLIKIKQLRKFSLYSKRNNQKLTYLMVL